MIISKAVEVPKLLVSRLYRKSLSTEQFCSSAVVQSWLPSRGEGSKFEVFRESIAMQLKSTFKVMEVPRAKIRRAAGVMYGCCTDPINHTQFIQRVDVPDTFATWFRITELHVWMCMVRLQPEGEEGRYMRNALVRHMWKDIDDRSKLLGPEALWERKKSIKLHVDEFRGSLIGYDEGLLTNDMCLASVLWRQFFAQKCEEPEYLELLVHYIRLQLAHLDMHAKNDLLTNGLVKWLPLRKAETEETVEAAAAAAAASY